MTTNTFTALALQPKKARVAWRNPVVRG